VAGPVQAVLLPLLCRAAGCGGLFFICRSCYRGQAYCSPRCRERARREQRRRANRKHQMSWEGRLDHCARQAAYRRRRAERLVTDQGSETSYRLPILAREEELIPREAWHAVSWEPICVVCGRSSRFIDPYPR
jgi:hypothetical protein